MGFLIGILIPKYLRRRLRLLFHDPLFWLITFWGNACIFGGAIFFYYLESDKNPTLQSMLDSLVWAVGIVTTVGGGDVHAVTHAGKILTIFMMMGGAVFLWSYMAIFIGILVEPELGYIQKEVTQIQHGMKADDVTLRRLEAAVANLEKAVEKDGRR